MTEVIDLPARLDTAFAPELAERLREASGQIVRLEGSAVTQIGALAAQVLLVAHQSAAADGRALHVVSLGADIRDQLAFLGLADHPLFTGEPHT